MAVEQCTFVEAVEFLTQTTPDQRIKHTDKLLTISERGGHPHKKTVRHEADRFG